MEHHKPGAKFEKIGQKCTVATPERSFYACIISHAWVMIRAFGSGWAKEALQRWRIGRHLGDVSQSPSAEKGFAAIKHIDTGAGVLYIYGNYNGDIVISIWLPGWPISNKIS